MSIQRPGRPIRWMKKHPKPPKHGHGHGHKHKRKEKHNFLTLANMLLSIQPPKPTPDQEIRDKNGFCILVRKGGAANGEK